MIFRMCSGQRDYPDAFHSAREDQSDSSQDHDDESSDEDSDNMVAYDKEHSRFSTMSDRECHKK